MTEARRPLRLAPFRAVTYGPDVDVASVICPPYDVIDPNSFQTFQAAHEHNIVRLTLPQPPGAAGAGHPGGAGDAGDGRAAVEAGYAQAGLTLRRWLAAGVLQQDKTAALYVYERQQSGRTALGLVGAVGLNGPVFAHEDTFPGPVADRAALMKATGAQLEPILLTYDGDGPASDVVDAVAATPALRRADLGPDERHRLWRIDDPSLLEVISADLAPRSALIADGHHRFAAYRAIERERPAEATRHGLAMLVDSARHPLELRGVHRSVAGLSFEQAIGLAAAVFEVLPAADPLTGRSADQPDDAAVFLVADGRREALLRLSRPEVVDGSSPAGLPHGRPPDAAVLTDVLLARRWNISDADERVEYHHDEADALRRAQAAGGVAVIVRPPALSDVLALAARDQRMPRKSTSFGPKPWTGLLMRLTGPDPVAHHR